MIFEHHAKLHKHLQLDFQTTSGDERSSQWLSGLQILLNSVGRILRINLVLSWSLKKEFSRSLAKFRNDMLTKFCKDHVCVLCI